MTISFDSIFLIVFGIISLVAGFLNKKMLFWTSIKKSGTKHLLKSQYIQVVNIIMGVISILIGVYLLKNK